MAPRKGSQTRSQDTDDTSTETDELAQLRAEMAELRGRVSSAESTAQSERQMRLKAEEATMSEAERRLRSDFTNSENLISTLNSEADGLEDRIAELSDEPGHGKEIAKMNRRLADIAADRRAETDKKNWLAGQIEKAKTEGTKRTEAAGREALANGTPLAELDPRAAAWIRAHPKAMNDPAYLNRVIAAGNYAINVEGIEANSPDYFAFVEDKIGDARQTARQPARDREDEGEDIAADPVRDRASPYSRTKEQDGGDLDYRVAKPQTAAAGRGSLAAVPVTRTAPGGTGTGRGRREPLLTPEQREVADTIYSHIANPADRYLHYSDSKKFMDDRRNGNFAAN